MNKIESEIWKDVVGYEGLYEVSNLSRVRSLDRLTKTEKGCRFLKGRILKGVMDHKSKYMIYGFSKNGLTTNGRLHVLVAMAFMNHIPCGFKLVVDHIDENPLNNNLNNLQIITHRKNIGKSKILHGKNKYTGVCFHKRNNKWMANIYIKSKSTHLGYFNSEQEAFEYRKKYVEINNLY